MVVAPVWIEPVSNKADLRGNSLLTGILQGKTEEYSVLPDI